MPACSTTGRPCAGWGNSTQKPCSAAGIEFDLLFGPAYKGIPLVTAAAIALAGLGRNVPICFNRKEAKDHGEGGVTVGAPLAGRVLIVDDVISAGTSVRESVEIIRAGGATPCGVAIALDRMERGSGPLSAVQEVRQSFQHSGRQHRDSRRPCRTIWNSRGQWHASCNRWPRYRTQYGATGHVSSAVVESQYPKTDADASDLPAGGAGSRPASR